jgi:hypothetical protein
MEIDLTPTPSFELPIKLSSGLVLSKLELECRGCARPYHLKQGYGRMGTPGARVVLAARSQCPRCFEVARFFVVLNKLSKQASIQRVSAFSFWLAQQCLRLRPSTKKSDLNQLPLAQEMTAWVARAKVSLGRYRDHDIPAWIELENSRWHFVGVQGTESTPVRLGEVVIHPGLLYRKGINTRV